MNLTEVKIEANLCCFHFFTLGRQPLRESFKEKNQKPKVMILTDFLLVKTFYRGKVSLDVCPEGYVPHSDLHWLLPLVYPGRSQCEWAT